jgi:hypothetical protein
MIRDRGGQSDGDPRRREPDSEIANPQIYAISIPRYTPWTRDHRDDIVPCELYARGDFCYRYIPLFSSVLVYPRESGRYRVHLGIWDIVLSLGEMRCDSPTPL